MKIPSLLARACTISAALVLFSRPAGAQTAPTGTIEGRVVNTRTGDYVEHARVTVDGTTLETFTDSGGGYRINNVPAGSANVKVFFTGFDPQVEAVRITPGTIAHHDFNLGDGRTA